MRNVCTVDGCDQFVVGRGLCRKHYSRLRTKGSVSDERKNARRKCSVEGCDRWTAARGLCQKHARRFAKTGTTDDPVRPSVCEVDGCELPVQAKGRCDRHYRQTRRPSQGQRVCRVCGKPLTDAQQRTRSVYCSTECRAAGRLAERKRTHRHNWLKKYGMTVGEYEDMVAAQEGRCAICGTTKPGSNGAVSWCVDHCHKTGAVRGLLCMGCNVGLGKFRDDPGLLEKAAAYLRR